jgi:histidine triad (HIT) family protein
MPAIEGQTAAMADCVFCEIAAGRAPADVVYADEHTVAFLDRTPLFKGHVLVVPRDHVPTLPDLPAAQIAVLFTVVQRIAAVMPDALDAHGTFVALNNVVSQSVPHLHVHVVPRRRKDGLRGFFWPRQRYLDALDATTHAARLRESLAREGL